MGKLIDLSGQRFDKLLVIEPVATNLPSGVRRRHWRCRCDCGNEVIRERKLLLEGSKIKSCGCAYPKYERYPGKKIDKITLIRPMVRDDPKRPSGKCHGWECECECGTISFMLNSNLTAGERRGHKSCGCEGRRKLGNRRRTHGMGRGEKSQFYQGARSRATRRNLPFDLDIPDIPDTPEVCPYLGIPLTKGVRRKTDNSPTIDRIVPSKGYVRGNIEIISDKANRIKNDATFEEFEKIYLRWKARLEAEDVDYFSAIS